MTSAFLAAAILVVCVGVPTADDDLAKAGGPRVPSHHSPFFKVEPEPSVTMGTEAMTVAVLELLGKE